MKFTTEPSARCRVLIPLGAAALVVLVGFWVITSLRIGADVRATVQLAQRYYLGDAVEALVQLIDAPDHPFQERNHAVWALGQLGEGRALPSLRKHYTGEPCDHENALCQRELAKAISLAEGGVNASAFLWRPMHGR